MGNTLLTYAKFCFFVLSAQCILTQFFFTLSISLSLARKTNNFYDSSLFAKVFTAHSLRSFRDTPGQSRVEVVLGMPRKIDTARKIQIQIQRYFACWLHCTKTMENFSVYSSGDSSRSITDMALTQLELETGKKCDWKWAWGYALSSLSLPFSLSLSTDQWPMTMIWIVNPVRTFSKSDIVDWRQSEILLTM